MAKKESDSGNLMELIFINSLTNKNYTELEDNSLKKLINCICSSNKIDKINRKIICRKYKKKSTASKGNPKADIEIIINKKKFYISLKSGMGNSLHEEKKESFLNFLKKFRDSNECLKIIEEHLSSYIKIRNSIVQKFFTSNKKAIIKRVLGGNLKFEETVNFYYATKSISDKSYDESEKIVKNGYFASKNHVENFMINSVPRDKGQSGTCDVGNLRYQAYNRKKYPKPQFKWPNPYEDLKELRNIND